MSFFSDINGFNKKAMNSNFEKRNENKTDFSEVDFCINDEENKSAKHSKYSENIFGSFEDFETIKEDYMYNYNLTEEEAEDYLNKHFTDEG